MREELKLKGQLPGLIKKIVASYSQAPDITHLEGFALPDHDFRRHEILAKRPGHGQGAGGIDQEHASGFAGA